MVYSHAVCLKKKKKKIQRSSAPFAQFSAMVTIPETMVQGHNQNTGIDQLHQSYLDFPSFTCTQCMYVFFPIQFYHMFRYKSTTTVKVQNCSITHLFITSLGGGG